MDAVLSFVEAGIGIAIVPSTVADDRFRITRMTSPPLTRAIQLSRRAGIELSRAAIEMEIEVRKVALERPSRAPPVPRPARSRAEPP